MTDKPQLSGSKHLVVKKSWHDGVQWCMSNGVGQLKTIERVSIECCKAKAKVITLANQKGRRQSGKPIKTQSSYTQPTARETSTHKPRLVLVSLLIR